MTPTSSRDGKSTSLDLMNLLEHHYERKRKGHHSFKGSLELHTDSRSRLEHTYFYSQLQHFNPSLSDSQSAFKAAARVSSLGCFDLSRDIIDNREELSCLGQLRAHVVSFRGINGAEEHPLSSQITQFCDQNSQFLQEDTQQKQWSIRLRLGTATLVAVSGALVSHSIAASTLAPLIILTCGALLVTAKDMSQPTRTRDYSNLTQQVKTFQRSLGAL